MHTMMLVCRCVIIPCGRRQAVLVVSRPHCRREGRYYWLDRGFVLPIPVDPVLPNSGRDGSIVLFSVVPAYPAVLQIDICTLLL
jgi:hypothetical protein